MQRRRHGNLNKLMILLLTVGINAKAQRNDKVNSSSILGTWTMSVGEVSPDTASDAQITSWSITFTKATKHWLAWHTDLSTSGMKKPVRMAWSGPANGKPQRLVGGNGSEAYHWDGPILVREANLGSGKIKHDKVTLSADGNTLIITDETTTPDSEALAYQVLHRQR